jgi:hypothetical protein
MNSLQRQRLLKADAFAFEPLNVASKHVSIIPSLFHANRQTTRGMLKTLLYVITFWNLINNEYFSFRA